MRLTRKEQLLGYRHYHTFVANDYDAERRLIQPAPFLQGLS
jgi:hypothetical protein